LDQGDIPGRLRSLAVEVLVQVVEHDLAFPTEIGTAFELHRALAQRVAEARRRNALPLVLSGNCNSALGTMAGLHRVAPEESIGVIWFDGHGDCNTPETFDGDFLDAMGLSTLTGLCWQTLAGTVPGFSPTPSEQVLLIGGHGMDEGARQVLSSSYISHLPTDELKGRGIAAALASPLETLKATGVKQVYIHLDVDVLDAQYAPANAFAPKGGLMPADILECIDAVAERFDIAGAAVASYDPAYDRENRVLHAALDFMEHVARLAKRV